MLIPGATEEGCKLVRNHGTVLKTGLNVFKEEGFALRVAHQLGLPVPAVHNISTTTEGVCEIHMDFVDGECLEDAWPSLSSDERISIAKQLGDVISKMQAATPPSDFLIGGCGGPARDCRYIGTYTGGPFQDEDRFNDFILELVKTIPPGIQNALADGLRRHNGQPIVLSHADLSPRNIIIKDGQLKALLDWEYAGWYPKYWEYVKFFERYTPCEGWIDLAGYIFPTPYPSELLTYQGIARWRRP